MIEISTAEPEEYHLLAELGRKAFFEAFSTYNDPEDMQTYLDLAFDPSKIKLHLTDSSIIFLIARYHGTPVGYAKMHRNLKFAELNNERQIQLERIYALSAYIGKKIGKSLMEKCIEISKAEHFEVLWLSVWQQNSKAVDFYKKWGFETIGYKKFVIGKEVNDDFVMALSL